MKEINKLKNITTILGVVVISILLGFTSCKKTELETPPGETINQEEVKLHSMIDNSVWKIDAENHSHVTNNEFIWDINFPTIIEYDFYSVDSVELCIVEQSYEYTYLKTQYSIEDNILKIKFKDELQGVVVNTPDAVTLIIDFYSQMQTIKYGKQ